MKKIQPILDFLEGKSFAVAGVSRDPKKFGGSVFRDLTERGYIIHPVNPKAEKIGERMCYPDVLSLPREVKKLFIVTSKTETARVMEQAITKGIKQIWIQQMSETPEALKIARENQVELITRECIYMYVEPVKGPHRFHRFFRKLFGTYPK